MVQFFSHIWDFFESIPKEVLISIFSLIFVASAMVIYWAVNKIRNKKKSKKTTQLKEILDWGILVCAIVICVIMLGGILYNMESSKCVGVGCQPTKKVSQAEANTAFWDRKPRESYIQRTKDNPDWFLED